MKKYHKYRRCLKENEIIQNEIQNLFEKGLIKQTESEFISPIVIVKKKDGSIRFCVDYQRYNHGTIKKNFQSQICKNASSQQVTDPFFQF